MRILVSGLLLVLLLLAGFGCSRNGEEPVSPAHGTLLLKLSIPTTYAVDESSVLELDVLFFNSDEKFLAYSAAMATGDGKYMVTSPIADNMTMLVVANSRASISSLAPVPLTTTLGDVEKMAFSIAGDEFNTRSTNIPMSARVNSLTVSAGTAPSISDIQLVRSVAKVDVLKDNNVSNFSLTGIGVANSEKFCLIPGKGALLNAPSTVNLADVDRNCSSTDPLYIYEKENIVVGESSRTKLIVKGVYSGNTYYYPIYFKSGTQFVNITRNYHYKFTIEKVLGRGYSSFDEAKNSRPVNMTVSVKAWEPNSSLIIFDGQYYIELPSRSITFSSGNTVSVETDTETSNWKLVLSETDGPLTPSSFDGKTSTVYDPASFNVSWDSVNKRFTISPQTSISQGSLVRYLFVDTGRLTFSLKLTQIPQATNNDWGDGDEGNVNL